MKIEKGWIIVGIIIGILITLSITQIIIPIYESNTFRDKEITGVLIDVRPFGTICNVTVDGYWVNMENITIKENGIVYIPSQKEYFFFNVQKDIDVLIGEKITIGYSVDGNYLAKIKYIEGVD